MKVKLFPADQNACGGYRVTWVGEALADHDVTVHHDYNFLAVWRDTIQGPTIEGLAEDVDADVVVIQRPLHRNRVELIAALQAEGIAVVVEIDDDFHSIHPMNPAWKFSNPLENADKNRDWLLRACKRADLVTVTTRALAERYGAHGRCVVLPNYVPEWYTRLTVGSYTRKNLPALTGTVVGWSGSTVTHPGDLEAGRGVAQAIRETGAGFHVIGTGVGVKAALGLDEEPTSTGWLPLPAYPEGVKQLDVGIVPLAATLFNEAKSWLKGLEMASVGVPFVASPTGPYRELARAGIGWVADSVEEWHGQIRQLVLDPVRREALSIAWRDEIARAWTIEHNAWRWLEAWEQARANARQRAAA